LTILLAGKRPDEGTGMKRSVKAAVASSTFDEYLAMLTGAAGEKGMNR